MNNLFRHRYTNAEPAAQHAEIRGESEFRLSTLRNETTELIDGLDAGDPERKRLGCKLAAIDQEIAGDGKAGEAL